MDDSLPNFDQLFKEHFTTLYNFIFRICLDDADTKDVLQETAIKLWKNFHKYDAAKPFTSWAITIAHRTILDHLKKKKTIPFSSLSNYDDEGEVTNFEDSLADETAGVVELLSNEADLEKIRQILKELSPAEREIILLHLDHDLTFEEISEINGKPRNTNKSFYRRTIQKVKSKF